MAARGRGRGRGRGSQMSFDYSQLGFTGGEALPAPVLQPPPTFPPLEHKAVPLKSAPEMEYMVALKRDFVEFLHSIRQSNDSASMIERFSDKYQIMNSNSKDSWDSQINWDFLPSELNSKGKKALKRKLEKRSTNGNAKKQSFDISKKSSVKKADCKSLSRKCKGLNKMAGDFIVISEWLDELAKLEVKDEDEEEGAKESEEKEVDDETENRENVEEDEDEEMDDGTDYVNNYFDNGEGYFDDEDDNLDDGPIY